MGTGDADQTAEGDAAVEPRDETTATLAEVRFSHSPPLAWWATLAALTHVALQRAVVPLWASQAETAPGWLAHLVLLALNLTGASALVSFGWALRQAGATADYSHAGRRLLIVALGSALVGLSAASLILPPGRIDAHSVVLAAAATHTLTVQLGMAALRAHPSLAGRSTLVLLAAASVFPLASMLLRQLMPLGPSLITQDGVGAMHALGEMSYLMVPLAGAFVVVPWGESTPSGRARAAGAVAAFAMGLLFAGASQLPAEEYGHLLYSTLRLEFALERASLGYAVPISLAVGAATAALLSRDPRHRQGGLALWLWLAAGYNPLSPLRLLLWALSATLLGRALISLRNEPLDPPTEKNAR